MTKNEIVAALEAASYAAVGILLSVAIPALLSERDSIPAAAGGLLGAAWLIWGATLLVKLTRRK